MTITFEKFEEYVHQGREIEFSFNERNYFLEPDYENSMHFYFYVYMPDPEDKKSDGWPEVFHGNIEDFLVFKFEGKYQCKENFAKIVFQCIL